MHLQCIYNRTRSTFGCTEQAREQRRRSRMATCAGAPILLKSVPSLLNLQQSSSANTNCKPAICSAKASRGSGSVRRVGNNRRSGTGSVLEKEEEGVVIGRRQAMALMGMATTWAKMPAMAAPNHDDILEKEPLTFRVPRPARKKGDEEKEEVLTVSVRVPRGEAVGFNVFVNLPDAQSDTPITYRQFAGKFFNVPNRLPNNPYLHTQLRIGVSDIIHELGLSQDPELSVTIVPTPPVLAAPILVKAVGLNLE